MSDTPTRPVIWNVYDRCPHCGRAGRLLGTVEARLYYEAREEAMREHDVSRGELVIEREGSES